MSPYEIQSLIFAILGTLAFLGFLSLIVIGVILLIKRLFFPDGIGAGEKRMEETVITKTLSKRENVSLGLITFYYISFENLNELRAPKKLYKSTNAGDAVKVTYEGQRLISLTVIERSNEKSIPNRTITGRFK